MLSTKNLLEARVHFGHMSKKWNPKMSKFILMKNNGLHIIDLNKTVVCLNAACSYLKDLALNGKRIMFVGTKEQAKSIISNEATRIGMPFVIERWLGGTLTNFAGLKRLIKKCQSFEKITASPAYKNLTKREQLTILRENRKLTKLLSGLGDVSRLPSAMFIVDLAKEHIAVREAISLGIPIVGVVDTNVNPDLVDLPIPANDDSVSSIEIILKEISSAIEEGLKERILIKQKEFNSKDSAPVVLQSDNGDLSSPIDVKGKQIEKKPTRITTGANKTASKQIANLSSPVETVVKEGHNVVEKKTKSINKESIIKKGFESKGAVEPKTSVRIKGVNMSVDELNGSQIEETGVDI